jgi:hypothetical protein
MDDLVLLNGRSAAKGEAVRQNISSLIAEDNVPLDFQLLSRVQSRVNLRSSEKNRPALDPALEGRNQQPRQNISTVRKFGPRTRGHRAAKAEARSY